MNSPLRPLLAEIRRIKQLGFDFIELAIEPPLTARQVRRQRRKILREVGDLPLFVHLPCFVSTSDLCEGVREASIRETIQVARLASQLKAQKLILHPSHQAGLARYLPTRFTELAQNFLEQISKEVANETVICIENMMPYQGYFFESTHFVQVFKDFPQLRLCLDLGHANVLTFKNRAPTFIRKFADRLEHLHIHDNRGWRDDHLPPGCGNIDFLPIFRQLRRVGFDQTSTLEIFTNPLKSSSEEDETFYLQVAREKAQVYWAGCER